MRYARDSSEFDRAIAFIDATFAVALTLLITTLDIEDRPSAFTSVSALVDAIGDQFFSFAITFVVIAGYWLIHHRMVASFTALDRPTIIANLCLIAAVVLLPFTTASVGDPGVAELPLSTALMAINIAAVSALHTVVWMVAARGSLIDPVPSSREWREVAIGGMVPVTVFLVSVPIAYLVSPDVARLSWLSLPVVDWVVAVVTKRRGGAISGRGT